ncbi:helix-turn-helix domain-containing protein [Chloroflexota bacterium]
MHLNTVTTLANACRMYGKDRKTVAYAIDAGNLAARKEGGIWLISNASLMDYWGRPTCPGCQKTRKNSL